MPRSASCRLRKPRKCWKNARSVHEQEQCNECCERPQLRQRHRSTQRINVLQASTVAYLSDASAEKQSYNEQHWGNGKRDESKEIPSSPAALRHDSVTYRHALRWTR